MATGNTRLAAVIDPILSTYARGYTNSDFVGGVLFPTATVPNRSMRVVRFGKEAFRMTNTRRAPGGDRKRVQYGYASDPIALVQDSLEGVVPVEHQEEAESVPGIDLGKGAVNMVLAQLGLGLEYDQAQLARNAANYSASNKLVLTGTARWTNAASTPQADMDAAKEAIRRSIGRYPNTAVFGPSAYNALKKHAAVKDQFKYTTAQSITAEMLAAFFDLKKVVVGKAVYLPEAAAESVAATDVWGDDVVLAYVPDEGDNFQVPSYGYTYSLKGYTQVAKPYFWEPNSSYIYQVTTERKPYLTGAEGGFLFQGAGLP